MKSYTVQRGRSVRAFLEPALRRALRRGRLSGLESVQVDDAWVRLCELPLFAQEAQLAGRTPLEAARQRDLQRWWIENAVVVLIGLLMLPLKLKLVLPLAAGWCLLSPLRFLQHRGRYQRCRALPSPSALLDAPLPPLCEELLGHLDRLDADRRPQVRRLIRALGRSMMEGAQRVAELETLLDAKERERLLSDLTEARRALQGTAASTEERRLLVQQLQTLERQEATLERAEAALRLARLKQELAHHGLEQLRMEMVIASSHDGELDRLLSTLEDSALQLQSEEELQRLLPGQSSSDEGGV